VRALDPRLLRRVRPARAYVVAVAAFGIAGAALLIIQAALLARGIATLSVAVLAPLALVVGGRVLLAWLGHVLAQRAATAVTTTLRRAVMRHALALGPQWLTGERSGEITALVTSGIGGLDAYVAGYLPQVLLAVTVPLIVLVAMARANLTAALTVLVTLPLIPIFMALVGTTTARLSRRRLASLGRLAHHFLDVVSGLTTLKSFGQANAQATQVRAVGDDYRVTTMRTLRLAFLSTLVLDLLATLSIALVAIGVGLRLVDGRLDLRTALFVLILAPEAYAPLRSFGAAFHASADGVTAMDEVERVLAVPLPVAGTGRTATWREATLVVDGVTVRHPGRRQRAPDAASLTVAPGEFVAIVGPNGAGKSTLLNVILGFAAADTGTVALIAPDGTSRTPAGLAPDDWRAHFAWVPQQPYLFEGTVAANIALGDPSASSERVAAAAERAALDVPLDRPVGDGGTGLSAGQRRRIAIARAVLRDAPIFLLDEPTAGLDDDTEREVLAGLRAGGRTVVAVAHRPATIDAADRVVAVRPAADAPSTESAPMVGSR
jgi:ATP-binding cassette subfamily C protein CydD